MTTAVEVPEKGHQLAAWVNFDGTGTVAIRASYNVSSITDNGTGDYTVNFTTAMPDVNFSIAGTAGRSGGQAAMGHNSNTAMSTSAVRIVSSRTTDGAKVDADPIFVSIFR